MRPRPLLVLAALLAARPALAFEWLPIAKADLLGGQFFFQGQNTSFSGNADWTLSPGMKFGENDALIPAATGSYRRTRDVQELIGGSFLTQESLDNTASLKWVHRLGDYWALKPGASFKNELIVESEDERLGKGLFDYDKLSTGLELERRAEGSTFRQGLNAYGVRFIHYNALAASSQDFGAEINSGTRVLDFNAYDYSIGVESLNSQGTLVSAAGLASYRAFPDQKVVTEAGTYSDRNRRDWYALATFGVQQKLPPMTWNDVYLEQLVGVSAGGILQRSNQNNYDTDNTRFNPNYYDYEEFSGGPAYAVKIARTLTVSASYDFARRHYQSRPKQDAAGGYGDGAVFTNVHTLTLGVLWPIVPHLSLKVQGTYLASISNMKFEQTYRYNYYTANYFAGVSLEL